MSEDAGAPRDEAPRRTREDADAGVARCVEMMTAGEWITGQSNLAVAEEFNVSPATVKNWATNASRIIRLAIEGDKEAIRARMFSQLETVVQRAMERTRPVTTKAPGKVTYELVPEPDLRAAVSAIDVQAKLLGLSGTRVDVVNHRVSHLSKAEHEAALVTLRGEIEAELARIEDES